MIITSLSTFGEICKELGQRARSRRKLLKLSRKELSQKSGISVPTISRFELSGVTTIGVMVKLAQAMGAVDTLDALFSPPKHRSIKEFMETEK